MNADYYLDETINEVEERIAEYELELIEGYLVPHKRLELENDVIEYKALLKKLISIR